MDAVQLLGLQLTTAHQWLDGAVRTATDEQLHWFPPSNALPAAVCYAHAVATEDLLVNHVLRSETPLSEAAWKGRTGLSEVMPRPGPEWRARSAHLDARRQDRPPGAAGICGCGLLQHRGLCRWAPSR